MLRAQQLLRERAAEGGFKLNVAKVPLARARAYAERVFKAKGQSLDEVIPDFDANYQKLQRALKQALNIPRSNMPVIEPTDITRFQRDLKSGHIDLFKPHFKGRIGMLKGKQTPMAPDKADAFLTGGVKDGDKKDDKVKVALTRTGAGSLLPIQSEVWLEKLVGNIAKYGLPSSGSPVLKATLIISADNRIIDGHHRWGQATLADPKLRMKTLRVPFKIKDLLDLARTYGAAIGRTYKESSGNGELDQLLAEMRGNRPLTVPLIETAKQQGHRLRDPKLFERRKPSIDAVMRFKHKGKQVDAKVQKTKWTGGKAMTYVWVTMDGKTFETNGVPKGASVIADV
jgi:hypothetical protein